MYVEQLFGASWSAGSFFCLSKGTFIYLSYSKLDTLRTTSNANIEAREREEREEDTVGRHFPFIASGLWMGQVTRIGSAATMWNGRSTPSSVQVQKPWIDFALCQLWSITTVGCGYHPQHTGVIILLSHQLRGAGHQEFCCQFLPKWQSWPFLFFNCFFVVVKQRLLLLFGAVLEIWLGGAD